MSMSSSIACRRSLLWHSPFNTKLQVVLKQHYQVMLSQGQPLKNHRCEHVQRHYLSTRTRSAKPDMSKVGKIVSLDSLKSKDKGPSSGQIFVKAGLPMILFSLGAAYVLKNALEGKTKEYEASRGQISKSERQARMEQEKDDMMQKLSKIKKQEFDNTKRIERPEEILERRRKERENRNVWYRRWGRWIIGRE